jgi:hypothetical protein
MHPTYTKEFSAKKIVSKYISLSVKFTTLLVMPLVLPGKLCFRDIQRVNNNGLNLRHTLIFGLHNGAS